MNSGQPLSAVFTHLMISDRLDRGSRGVLSTTAVLYRVREVLVPGIYSESFTKDEMMAFADLVRPYVGQVSCGELITRSV